MAHDHIQGRGNMSPRTKKAKQKRAVIRHRDGLFEYPDSFAEDLFGAFGVQLEAQLVADLEKSPDAIYEKLKFFVHRVSESQEALEEWISILYGFMMRECDSKQPDFHKDSFQFERRFAAKCFLDLVQMLGVDGPRNTVLTAAQGFLLGLLVGYLDVRIHSPYVTRSHKWEDGSLDGGEKKALSKEEREAKRKSFLDAANEIHKRNSSLSLTALLDRVAEKSGVCRTTIYNFLTKEDRDRLKKKIRQHRGIL